MNINKEIAFVYNKVKLIMSIFYFFLLAINNFNLYFFSFAVDSFNLNRVNLTGQN